MSLRFVEHKENILFIGSSSVGKTHLATSIGIEASSKRISTYFINCHVLIAKLVKAHHEKRHEAVLNQYFKSQVLVIDEIGYLPIDKLGANLDRLVHHSTIIKITGKSYRLKSEIDLSDRTSNLMKTMIVPNNSNRHNMTFSIRPKTPFSKRY